MISVSPLFTSFKNKEKKLFNFPITCNAYNWFTFYGRQNKKWGEDLDKCFADLAQTGITAYEPGLESVQDVKKLAPFLKKYNLTMPSVYVNNVLHKAEDAEKSIADTPKMYLFVLMFIGYIGVRPILKMRFLMS